MNDAVSMVAPSPITNPLGLIKNTRPLEVKLPRISEGMPLTTRFKTDESVLFWRNRTASSCAIENSCQLIIAPLLF